VAVRANRDFGARRGLAGFRAVTRVLITGATGFIGRHCLERLLACGHEVHAASRQPPRAAAGPVHWHAADLREPEAARDVIAAARPSHLLHLAWEATPRLYAASPENLRWLGAGTAMLAAFGDGGGQRFVGAGSAAEYADGPEPRAEDASPIRPATIYGKCKAAFWLAAQAAAQHYGFAAAWGRIFLPYGPGDPPGRLIPTVLTALSEGRPVATTHGRQLRDFIYAPDAADLLVRLLFAQETGAFNIATGRATPVGRVVDYLADRRGGRALLRVGALEPRPDDPAVLVADMTKVRARLGWSAPTAIEDGLSRLLSLA
jgi:nucleoside-diphosphate-sugar epimerase